MSANKLEMQLKNIVKFIRTLNCNFLEDSEYS